MMKPHKLAITLVMLLVGATSHAGYDSDVMAYVNKYKAMALESQRRFGIPATITLAQGILESNSGKSRLTRESHNHFGVKGKGTCGSVKAKDDEPGLSTFRKYNSDQESFDDHARVLLHSRYQKLLRGVSIYDYRAWAYAIKAGGYATAPLYAESLIDLIDHFQLYKINNGVKLRANKKLVIVGYKTITVSTSQSDSIPVIANEAEVALADDEMSDEERELEGYFKDYPTDLAINNVPCTVLLPGKTLGTICRDYMWTSKEKLMKYNEITHESQLRVGQIVYLDKKKSKYEGKGIEYCEARDGETLYDVSQRYGVQVMQLAKLNDVKNVRAVLPYGMRIALR